MSPHSSSLTLCAPSFVVATSVGLLICNHGWGVSIKSAASSSLPHTRRASGIMFSITHRTPLPAGAGLTAHASSQCAS